MLASPFSDHAVLQRDLPVPVWGRASADEKIIVHFHDQTLETVANEKGEWSVQLSPMPANATGAELSVTGQTTLTLRDVVVGEVWLASGQSNMEWPLQLALDSKTEIAAADSPLIRHLKVEHSPADLPANGVKTSGWKLATPQAAGNFSAVGYFFARELAQKLKIPVGIIDSSWGGTPIESWLAEPVLRTTQAWPRFEGEWQKALEVFPQKMAEYPALDAAWHKADEAFHLTGKPNPLPWPHPPVGPGTAYAPGGLFNGMINPLVPYALRGALWYQGESNAGRAAEYAELLQAMISDWRKSWAQGDFPFLVVQLPNYANHNPGGREWAGLREAQAATALKLPNVGLAVTVDVGDADNIHPANKKPVGERLALLAEARIHGLPVEASGPVFRSVQRVGSTMRIQFTHAKNLAASQNSPPGFEIAGQDRIFHPANASIEDETVLVSAPNVLDPVAVRYGWINNPVVSLHNASGLPAAPFRTDNW